jgi:LPXTG-motif cell wall-anchored protein
VLGNDMVGCPDVTLTADAAEHGVVTFAQDGSFVYTPSPGFMGVEKFEYQLRDAAANVLASATVRIEVLGPPCVAHDDSFTVHSGDVLVVAASGVLANDVVCPQFLDVHIDNMGGDPDHGTATLDGDGGLHYTPDPGYVGPDQIGYEMVWGSLHFEFAVVTIDVLPPCETALVDDDYATGTDQVLHVSSPGPGQNDTLCEGAVFAVADGPDHGSVTLLGWGDLTYEPDAGFVGTDTFTYLVEQAPQPNGYFGEARPRGLNPQPKGSAPTLIATVTITVAEGATATTTTTSTTSTTVPDGPTTVPAPSGTLPQTGNAHSDIVAGLGAALMLMGTCLLLAIRRPH